MIPRAPVTSILSDISHPQKAIGRYEFRQVYAYSIIDS